jgi:diguanylate cyclase (GGDEF)-like protein
MSKLNNILKENAELKKELENILEVLKENEIKQKGFKIVEYAFLLAENLEELDFKPLKYIEDIFLIDKAHLFINEDMLPFDLEEDTELNNISFADSKTFTYFFIEKRPYLGTSKINMINEFDIFPETESYLIAPLIEEDKIIGSLNLYSRNKKQFGNNDSPDFIKDLTFKMSIALRKMYNTKFIEKQSRIDDMTGCYNKLAMNEFLDLYINKHIKYEDPFCFILFDLDNFKLVNDSQGHLKGDEVIKKIGNELRNNFRKSDVIGRFGGDEFYMLIPNCSQEASNEIVKKVSKIVNDILHKYKFEGNVGITGGFVSIPEDFDETINAETILKLADNRLYIGKNMGKGIFVGANDDIL